MKLGNQLANAFFYTMSSNVILQIMGSGEITQSCCATSTNKDTLGGKSAVDDTRRKIVEEVQSTAYVFTELVSVCQIKLVVPKVVAQLAACCLEDHAVGAVMAVKAKDMGKLKGVTVRLGLLQFHQPFQFL